VNNASGRKGLGAQVWARLKGLLHGLTPNPGSVPSLMAPRLRYFGGRAASILSHVRTLALNLALLMGLVILISLSVNEFFRDQVTIEPFEVPKALQDKGYSGHAFAVELEDQINAIAQGARTAGRKGKTFRLPSERVPNIDVPTTHVSLQAAIGYIREFFGHYPSRVTGEVELAEEGTGRIQFIIRISNGSEDARQPAPSIVSGTLDQIDNCLTKGAEYILRYNEPLLLASYLHTKGDDDRCLSIIQYCIYRKPNTLTDPVTRERYSSDAPWAFLLWGDVLYDQLDYDGADRKYQRVIDLAPNLAAPYERRAAIKIDQGHYKTAEAASADAYRRGKQYPDALVDWGYALFWQRNYEGAISKYKQAIEIDPERAAAFQLWGEALAQEQDVAGAILKIETAIEINQKLSDPRNSLGNVFVTQRRYAEAIREYKKAIELEPNPRLQAVYHSNLGEALESTGDLEGAVLEENKAKELLERLPDAYEGLGDVLGDKGNYPQAQAMYQKAVALEPQTARYYRDLARSFIWKQDYDNAIATLQKALAIDTGDQLTVCLMGDALRLKGDFTAAEAQYDASQKMGPRLPNTYDGLGKVLLAEGDVDRGRGNPSVAEEKYNRTDEMFRKALELDPKSTAYWVDYGHLLDHKGDYKGAFEKYSRALDLDPQNYDALYGWGEALMHSHDPDAAREKYELAVRLDPSRPGAQLGSSGAPAAARSRGGAKAAVGEAGRLERIPLLRRDNAREIGRTNN
jgi:tetratricopeptide (TPR) repeat protein